MESAKSMRMIGREDETVASSGINKENSTVISIHSMYVHAIDPGNLRVTPRLSISCPSLRHSLLFPTAIIAPSPASLFLLPDAMGVPASRTMVE